MTVQSGFTFFVFDVRDTKADTRTHYLVEPPYYGGPFYDPFFGPGPYYGGFGYYYPGPYFRHAWGPADIEGFTTTRYLAYSEIVMLTPEQAKAEPRALDANDLIARLTPPLKPAG